MSIILTLEELAQHLGAEPSERPGPLIAGVKPVEFAGAQDITYVAAAPFVAKLREGAAAAVIILPDLDPCGLPHIRSKNPEAAFARLTALYYPHPEAPPGISARAEVHPEAVIGQGVSVGPFAVVAKGASIGDGSVIEAHSFIGENVRIGSNTRIFPHVTIYARVTIGDRVIIHSGTVIGADGFGFARDVDEHGAPLAVKKYHSGTVEIGDDVEIGALCAVDRALAGVTTIKQGAKIDNLVQVAHNVTIGSGTVIAAQSGVAGSSTLGDFCMVGGQTGIRDHVRVGHGAMLATKAGIYRDVPDRSAVSGIPAMPHQHFLRVQSAYKRLPEILDRIRKLEAALKLQGKEKE